MSSHNPISIRALEIGYGAQGYSYMHRIDCHAQHGELIALVGRNGVGKSTLLRCIAGLQSPLGGQVLLHGSDVQTTDRARRAQLLSFIPADPARSTNTTVREFVTLSRYPRHGWFAPLDSDDQHEIDTAIHRVGLSHLAQRHLDHLSDGERQRAMIAFALAQDTPIVLMDEPTAFLDLPNKFEVVRLLRDMALSGKTIVFSTHDIPTAFSMADTIWLMLPDGLSVGAPEDLILSNTINRLMDGSHVAFDTASGHFVYAHDGTRRPVALNAPKGVLRTWTVHALERNGFTISTTPTPETPIITAINPNQLTLQTNGKSLHFGSIHDLMLTLRQS